MFLLKLLNETLQYRSKRQSWKSSSSSDSIVLHFSEIILTHFTILCIDPTRDEEIIKRAYRTCALKYHPDRNDDATEKFQILNNAYIAIIENL